MRTQSICRLVSLLASLLPVILGAQVVQIGASYNDVILALGEPDGELSAGSKQILTYGTAQVTLRDKEVTAISSEFERLLAERANQKKVVQAKRDAQLVSFRGQWVTPEKKSQMIQIENRKRSLNSTNQADAGIWLTDFNKASALAESQNRQMLLNFTGSDWSNSCRKLDREVFSQSEFMNYARKHYVLVKIDFPQRTPQPPELKQQNNTLARKYRVQDFPSIVILKPSGKLHTIVGYARGGPKAFLMSIR